MSYQKLSVPVPVPAPMPQAPKELRSLYLNLIPSWVNDDELGIILKKCGITNRIKRIDYNNYVRYKSGRPGVYLKNKKLDATKECYVHFEEPLDKEWCKEIDRCNGRLPVTVYIADTEMMSKTHDRVLNITFHAAWKPLEDTVLNNHQLAARVISLEDTVSEMQETLVRQETALRRFEVVASSLSFEVAKGAQKIHDLELINAGLKEAIQETHTQHIRELSFRQLRQQRETKEVEDRIAAKLDNLDKTIEELSEYVEGNAQQHKELRRDTEYLNTKLSDTISTVDSHDVQLACANETFEYIKMIARRDGELTRRLGVRVEQVKDSVKNIEDTLKQMDAESDTDDSVKSMDVNIDVLHPEIADEQEQYVFVASPTEPGLRKTLSESVKPVNYDANFPPL